MSTVSRFRQKKKSGPVMGQYYPSYTQQDYRVKNVEIGKKAKNHFSSFSLRTHGIGFKSRREYGNIRTAFSGENKRGFLSERKKNLKSINRLGKSYRRKNKKSGNSFKLKTESKFSFQRRELDLEKLQRLTQKNYVSMRSVKKMVKWPNREKIGNLMKRAKNNMEALKGGMRIEKE